MWKTMVNFTPIFLHVCKYIFFSDKLTHSAISTYQIRISISYFFKLGKGENIKESIGLAVHVSRCGIAVIIQTAA